MEYRTSYYRRVRCKNGLKFRIDFLEDKSKKEKNWSDLLRCSVIAKSARMFFEAYGIQQHGFRTNLLVPSKSGGRLAIAVIARNAKMDVKNMVALQSFLSQFVDQDRYIELSDED